MKIIEVFIRFTRIVTLIFVLFTIGVVALLLTYFYFSARDNPRALYNYARLPELVRDRNATARLGNVVFHAPEGGEVCVIQDSTDLSDIIRSLQQPTYDEGVWYVVRQSGEKEDVQWVRSTDYLLMGPSKCSLSGSLTLNLSREDNLGYVAHVEE